MPTPKRLSKRTASQSGSKKRRRSSQELERIDSALTEPIIVIASPVFMKKNAERLIFDVPVAVPRLPVSWYCPAIDRATPPKRSIVRLLTREEELVLFRQYNFARMKLQFLQDKITNFYVCF